MSRAKELAKNTVIITIGKISTQLISFFLLPLYTSKLSPEEYGNYDLVISISAFLVPIITMLLEESMFRFMIDAKDIEEKRKIVSHTFLNILFNIIFFSILLILFFLINKNNIILFVLLYAISSTFVSLANALSRSEGKIILYSASNFIINVMIICFNLIFILIFNLGYEALIYSSLISNILVSMFVFIKLNVFRQLKQKKIEIVFLKKMLKYSIPLVPNTICWAVINMSDRLILNSFIGAESNGIYSIAYKFPNILNNFYAYFNVAWRETSARILNDGNYNKEYLSIYTKIKYILFSLCILIISFMPFVFPILIDQQYNKGLLYIPILTISVYYSSISGFYGGIFTAFKNTKFLGISSFIAAFINLGVDFLLINKLGIMAAAVSTFVSSIFLYIFRGIFIEKYVKLENRKINFILIIIFCVICFLYYSNKILLQIFGTIFACICTIIFNFRFISNYINKFRVKLRKNNYS